jgi:response regulator of citrate/malate metabolism
MVSVFMSTCGCGCCQPVARGRKFINQQHYDKSKGLSAATAAEVITQFSQGKSAKQLAGEFGVAHTTVYRILRTNMLM